MERHVYYVQFVKQLKCLYMNTMECLEMYFIYFLRNNFNFNLEKCVQKINQFTLLCFSPSSSKEEKIKTIYYDAEYYGQQNQCDRYYSDCDKSFLDLFSEIMSVTVTT